MYKIYFSNTTSSNLFQLFFHIWRSFGMHAKNIAQLSIFLVFVSLLHAKWRQSPKLDWPFGACRATSRRQKLVRAVTLACQRLKWVGLFVEAPFSVLGFRFVLLTEFFGLFWKWGFCSWCRDVVIKAVELAFGVI